MARHQFAQAREILSGLSPHSAQQARILASSALDFWLRGKLQGPYVNIWYPNGVEELSPRLESAQFDHLWGYDLRVCNDKWELLVQCNESFARSSPKISWIQGLSLDPYAHRFTLPPEIEPQRAREQLKNAVLDLSGLDEHSTWEDHWDAALLLARHRWKQVLGSLVPAEQIRLGDLSAEQQRLLLNQLVLSPNPSLGLNHLYRIGFIAQYWPPLAHMAGVNQSKEDHPEGDVWDHSLAALDQRKTMDLRLSLAILLHDVGKPVAIPQGGRRFHDHANLGSTRAYRFLSSLGYSPQICEDVAWLVQYHMIPPALNQSNLKFFSPIIEDRRFPLLLELFRCDVESTYRSPQAFFRVSGITNRFLGKRPGRPQSAVPGYQC